MAQAQVNDKMKISVRRLKGHNVTAHGSTTMEVWHNAHVGGRRQRSNLHVNDSGHRLTAHGLVELRVGATTSAAGVKAGL